MIVSPNGLQGRLDVEATAMPTAWHRLLADESHDGTDKIRLTNFNDPDNPMSHGDRLICADSDWSAGRAYVTSSGYVQTSLFSSSVGCLSSSSFSDAIAHMASAADP